MNIDGLNASYAGNMNNKQLQTSALIFFSPGRGRQVWLMVQMGKKTVPLLDTHATKPQVEGVQGNCRVVTRGSRVTKDNLWGQYFPKS